MVTLVQVTGDLLFLDGNDEHQCALEMAWKSGLQRYLNYCEQHDIKPTRPHGIQLIWISTANIAA
ncbi:hypothetical protein ACU4GD_14285 [Cupriavidus basilensis]